MTKPLLWTRLQARWALVIGLLLGLLDPLDPGVFQTVFGEILTLLIALEFNHTLQYVSNASRASSRPRWCSSSRSLLSPASSSFSTCVTWTRGSCSRWPQSRWRWASPTG